MKSTVAMVVAYFFAAVLASCATTEPQRGAFAEYDATRLAALLQRQLMRCWMPPKRIVDTNLTVRVLFKLNRDGSLADVPTVVKPGTDPLSQAANESALRAVRQCTPLQLPADKYEYWQDIEATFDPRAIRNSDSAR